MRRSGSGLVSFSWNRGSLCGAAFPLAGQYLQVRRSIAPATTENQTGVAKKHDSNVSLPKNVLKKLTKTAFPCTEAVVPLAGLRVHLAERYFQVRRSHFFNVFFSAPSRQADFLQTHFGEVRATRNRTCTNTKTRKNTTTGSVFATRARGFSTRPCIFDGSNQKLTSKFSCLFEQKTKVSRHDILSLQ